MLPYPTFEGYSRKVMTLTMIIKNDEILLGMKNRGMGKGKWNGFGGKVEPNETIDDGAKREVKEECGLDVISMDKIGIIEFEYVGSKELLEGHIYLCNNFDGDIIESDEMAPIKWFKLEDEPCDSMWIDHRYWFPILLKKVPFKAHFKYLNDDTMLENTIILLNSEKKTKETWITVVITKDSQILVPNGIEGSTYFNKLEQVKEGESVENAAQRYLKIDYEVPTDLIQKIAVIDFEFLDKSYIQEVNFFVVDVTKLTDFRQIENAQWLNINNIPAQSFWPYNHILSKLSTMEPFKAYYLINNNFDNVLCSKYL